MASQTLPASLPGRFPVRLPLGLLLLAIPSLCSGLLGLFLAFNELSGAMQERHRAVEQVRDAQLQRYDRGSALPVLQGLPRADAERLSLLLGDELVEQRRLAVPMALLLLVGSWLLLTGALGALRRHEAALPLWRWACLVNIPIGALSLLVLLVRTRDLVNRIGPPLAEAMAKVSKRDAAAELQQVWTWTREIVLNLGVLYGCFVLCLLLTVYALRRHLSAAREA